MGFFDWISGSAKEVQEAPKRSEVEEMLAKKYAASFKKPQNAGTTELVNMFNQCREDLRSVRDPELIIIINYFAIECLDAYFAHLIDTSELAFKERKFHLMFEVLKQGMSIIKLNGLTLPEIEEKISPIITMFVSTEIPEEIKLFKYIKEENDFDVTIEQEINFDAIERILKFCQTYKGIMDLLAKTSISIEIIKDKKDLSDDLDLDLPETRFIFGNYIYRQSNILNLISKIEKYLEFMKKSVGSTLETFRDDYLCHVVYARGPEGIYSILNGGSLLIVPGGLWFCINRVHSPGNPALIFCMADLMQEAKERRLNFEILLAPDYKIKFKFISKYNLFYEEEQSRYVTFKEIKDILKTGDYNAAIYPSEKGAKEKTQSLAVCILDMPVSFYAKYCGVSPATFKPKYQIYSIQKVRGNEDPRRQMFNDIQDAGTYLMNTSEGKQILKSMLPRR